MLLGMFTGFLDLVGAITAEKRLRVTELVLSAIPPRTWMDGKLAGVAAVSLLSTLTVTCAAGAVLLALRLDGIAVPSLAGAAQWRLLVLLLPVGVLGFLFWFTLFAAVAATMEDPATSGRQVLLLVPFVPAALCLPVLFAPNTPLATVLTLLPPTAPFVLLTRVAVTTVPAWEAGASIVLLALATLWLRVVASRVFALGVLMYGKEASWREVRRWMAEA
jgi:ABC-2 type transport system permease protein